MLGTPWYWPQTSRPPPPPIRKKDSVEPRPLFSVVHQKMKSTEQAWGAHSYIYCLLRERGRERRGGWEGLKKKRKKKTQERKREGDSGGVAMVTEIWLLFKNLECRWWWDECMCVCVCFFFPPRLSLSVLQILWMCWIPFDFTEDWNAISSFFFKKFLWPEGGVSGHVEHRRLVWNVG